MKPHPKDIRNLPKNHDPIDQSSILNEEWLDDVLMDVVRRAELTVPPKDKTPATETQNSADKRSPMSNKGNQSTEVHAVSSDEVKIQKYNRLVNRAYCSQLSDNVVVRCRQAETPVNGRWNKKIHQVKKKWGVYLVERDDKGDRHYFRIDEDLKVARRGENGETAPRIPSSPNLYFALKLAHAFEGKKVGVAPFTKDPPVDKLNDIIANQETGQGELFSDRRSSLETESGTSEEKSHNSGPVDAKSALLETANGYAQDVNKILGQISGLENEIQKKGGALKSFFSALQALGADESELDKIEVVLDVLGS